MSILDNVAGDLINSGLGALSGAAQNFITSSLNELANAMGMDLPIALLGDIPLGVKTYFEGMEESFGGDYVEHGLIGGKPRLQWMGDKLDEIKWILVFHAGFCDPEVEYLKLKQVVADHTALPLVFANGDYKGWFIVTEANATLRQTMRDGTVIWLEANATLREYVRPPVLAEATPKQPAKAAESTKGGKTKPARTKNTRAKARSSSSPATRNAP